MRRLQTTLAVSVSLAFSTAFGEPLANQNDQSDPGRRIDNARVDQRAMPPASEMATPSYPLPSGLTRRDVAALQAQHRTLPVAAPDVSQVLAETDKRALFASGKADLTDAARAALAELATPLKGKPGLRIALDGHTDNQHLSARSRQTFRDNQALSEARALAVAAYLKDLLGIPVAQMSLSGHGDSQALASNANPEGMARNRRVEVRAWFNAPAQPVVVPVAMAPCAARAETPSTLPFRVSVDGVPVDTDGRAGEADRQRCTDVALERGDIQIRFDGLATAPIMNVWATPSEVVRGEATELRMWANYLPWIKKAELRLFRDGQKPQENPLAVLPADWQAPVGWTVPADFKDDKVFYLLRVYDEQGRYDETALKPLTLLTRARGLPDRDKLERERLAGYGENSLVLRNIPVTGGTVTVNGSGLKSGQRIRTLGLEVPVDADGKFAIKQILPAGPHSVEVRVKESDGKESMFRRNLTIPKDDWFLLALGDLTVGHNHVNGPARLVTGDTQHYEGNTYIDGRGAFYLKGKIKGEYLLTASADTGEQPLKDLFSNFSSKDPRYLLRNIDPNLYYPVYGDDSTTVDDAPTRGKFYVKLERGDSHVMWGNFQTAWSGSELTQYSRGLYGANVRYRSEATTAWGEKQTQLDAFAAEPGTLGARDEFRGTGGSLYYLRHQDITVGSERIWIELRDRDSGLVIERKQLVVAQDYDLNALQGRILLREPLSSTGAASSLIATSAVSGNPVYLVATYEYAPGLTATSGMVVGGHASHWLNDHVQIGATTYRQGDTGADQTLRGVDATVRYKPGTWVKVEAARSTGTGSGSLLSQDGGYIFNSQSIVARDANAQRIEAAVDLAEVTDGGQGKLAAYAMNRERGYTGPGQIGFNGEAVKQSGLKANVALGTNTTLEAKADQRDGDIQDSSNVEVAVRQKLGDEWVGAVGIRHDDRENHQPNASALLSQNGARTDAQVRIEYHPLKEGGKPGEREDWEAFAFAQGTLERTGTRLDNNRGGVGGAWRINDRFKVLAEGSSGNQGLGGKIGSEYRLSDRSNVYLNYQMETETPDVAWRGRQGTWVSGVSSTLSEGLRVFGETRAQNGAGPQSLSNAFGLDWAPNDRWTYGVKGEVGTLSDPLAGDLQRHALGLSLGYREGGVRYAGNLEWRDDDSNVSGNRTTWLIRNSLGVQATKAWRLFGKLNYAHSTNSQGAFMDGNYHELVAGAAYRPTQDDRWNMLFKYTNLYNVPSPGQLTPTGAIADYAQRSQVIAVDAIYDVVPWLSVGSKVAYRYGELRPNKTSGEWFDSRASLVVLRADWHWVREWDALIELRRLRATEAADARAGVLLGIYRHVADGVKVGVGYNFTRYSDDLTDLAYRSRGWFINVLGTY